MKRAGNYVTDDKGVHINNAIGLKKAGNFCQWKGHYYAYAEKGGKRA